MAPIEQACTADPLIREIRETRFTHGIVCPRCQAQRSQRWGRFSGRQRYFCRACRRTFSDFTLTPAAYLKRLDAFAKYRQCMRASSSVRRAAMLVGVHKDTAFRWRHRLLDEQHNTGRAQLGGIVEILDVRFRYAEKGVRGKQHARRRGARGTLLQQPSVWVSFLADRAGSVAAAVTGGRRPGAITLARLIGPRLAADATLASSSGPLSAHATLANSRGLAHWLRVRATRAEDLRHTATVAEYVDSFRDWLEKFRGVSTCYLSNYLAWHDMLHHAERAHLLVGIMSWALPPPTPTIPADTARRHTGAFTAPPGSC